MRTIIRTTKPLLELLNDIRRDAREDRNYQYCDILSTQERVLEVAFYITRNKRPVQWKRAMLSMLNDPYTGNLIKPYLVKEDIKLSKRSAKRDQVKREERSLLLQQIYNYPN